MKPPKAGVWLVDTEIGEYQEAGMQTSFTVIDTGTTCEIHCTMQNIWLLLDTSPKSSNDGYHPKKVSHDLAPLNCTYN